MGYLCANDTISAPGYTWTNNADTGMYRPVTNEIGIVCASQMVAAFKLLNTVPTVEVTGSLNIVGGAITQKGSPLTGSRLSVDASNSTILSGSNLNVISATTTYKLISNIPSASNGTYKYVLNQSTSATATVGIRNSADTATLSNVFILPKQTKMFIWYSPSWYTF